MRRRIRIATVGVLAVMVIGALSGTAGAATGGTYSTSANGGFISLSLLNLIGLTGGGSSATASSNGTDTASGTGLCATLSESATTCPTTTDASTADVINTTANATSTSSSPGTDAPAAACLVPPLSLVIITAEAACGRATTTEDASGNPSASGEGDLAKVTVSLGAALPSLAPLLGNGTLCGTSSSPAATTTDPGLVSGLLNTVNGILSTAGLGGLTASASNPLNSICSIISGLTANLPILGGLLSNATVSTPLLSVTVGDSTSTITNSTASATTSTETAGDSLVTTTATTEGADVNLLGMLDIKVLPNSASITTDTTSGIVQQPTAVTGILSVQEGSSAPTVLSLPDLSSLLGNLLNSLGLSSLINPQLTTIAESSTTLDPSGHSGSAEAADLKLNLLGGLVSLALGDAKVAASTTTAAPIPAIVTTPAVTPAAPAAAIVPAAAVVPGVTTVHTGEFWSGTLPIILVIGMALAGTMLIGRRRVFSAARSLTPFARHSTFGSAGGPPPGPASGTSSVPPPVSGPARRQSL